MRFMVFLSVILISAGCTTMNPNDDFVRSKTAVELQLPTEAVVVYDRVDSGVRTDYRVQTIKGEHFNCHITGKILTSTRGISEPVCSIFTPIMENNNG